MRWFIPFATVRAAYRRTHKCPILTSNYINLEEIQKKHHYVGDSFWYTNSRVVVTKWKIVETCLSLNGWIVERKKGPSSLYLGIVPYTKEEVNAEHWGDI